MYGRTLIIACFLLCRTVACAAEDFGTFNTKINAEYNIEKLKAYAEEERLKFEKTGDRYFLYNQKYTLYIINSRLQKPNESLKVLSWICEDAGNAETQQIAWVQYNLASMLTYLSANNLSQEYALKALHTAEKLQEKKLLPITYSLVASNYYNARHYTEAASYYEKAKLHTDSGSHLYTASMLNNIGLSYMQLEQNEKARQCFLKALHTLEKIPKMDSQHELFYIIVQGNLGTILNKLKKPEEASVLLEKELQYYFDHPENLQLGAQPGKELLDLYRKSGNEPMIAKTISRITHIENKYHHIIRFPLLNEALYNYYTETGNTEKALAVSKELLLQFKAYSDSIIRQTGQLNDIMYRDKLQHMKSDAVTRKLELRNAVTEKQNSQILLLISSVVGGLALIIGWVIFRNKQKSLEKDSLIAAQKQELEINRNKILESEVRIQQEKITNLALNLKLKMDTEKAFLTKINELKRKKNSSPEDILKDLQLSVTNMLNIDKRLITDSIETDEIYRQFKQTFSQIHPNLTKNDLEFCCYFRLNLSAKEIGTIFGMSDVSVRVMKNKIKNKIGLSADQSLDKYLLELPLN